MMLTLKLLMHTPVTSSFGKLNSLNTKVTTRPSFGTTSHTQRLTDPNASG